MSLLSNKGKEVFQLAIALVDTGELGLLRRALNYWWVLRCLKVYDKSVDVALASASNVHEMQKLAGMTKDDLIHLLEKRLETMAKES